MKEKDMKDLHKLGRAQLVDILCSQRDVIDEQENELEVLRAQAEEQAKSADRFNTVETETEQKITLALQGQLSDTKASVDDILQLCQNTYEGTKAISLHTDDIEAMIQKSREDIEHLVNLAEAIRTVNQMMNALSIKEKEIEERRAQTEEEREKIIQEARLQASQIVENAKAEADFQWKAIAAAKQDMLKSCNAFYNLLFPETSPENEGEITDE